MMFKVMFLLVLCLTINESFILRSQYEIMLFDYLLINSVYFTYRDSFLNYHCYICPYFSYSGSLQYFKRFQALLGGSCMLPSYRRCSKGMLMLFLFHPGDFDVIDFLDALVG
jgi:hypothetical protein